MSWQEELRRLDAELAGGNITRHEHRKQRDELLAAASGGGVASPLAAPLVPAGSQPHWQSANPVQSEAGPSEQAQPGPPPEAPAAPQTPTVLTNPSADLLATDRPTSAPSPADEQPTDSMGYPGMSEAPTVITRAVMPGDLPGLAPPSPRHFSGVERQPSTPMPAHSRVPGRTWVFLGLGAFLVIGLIVGATFFFSKPSTGTAAPTSPVNPQLDVEAKLPALPGKANPNNSTMSIDKAVQLQVISAGDAPKVRASGAQEVVYRASSDATNVNDGYLMLAIPTGSTNDAAKLVQGLRDTLTGSGFKADPVGPGDAGTAYTGSNPTGQVTALWYTSGTLAIGIGVSQPPNGNSDTLHTRLVQVRDSVAAALPPG